MRVWMHGRDAGMAAESREQAKGAPCILIVTLSGGMNQVSVVRDRDRDRD